MTPEQYIGKYAEMAVKEMKRSGVPASITLSQGMLESGNGNSYLAKDGNNHFGIKCHKWEGEKIYADDDAKENVLENTKV
jgi:flagellum-specific peptidoglycan hydrolase FlgJ